MLITSVQAQEAAPPAATPPSPLAGFLPLIVMVALFYFLLIRPQQKKIAEHKKMINALRRGDKVMTSGGIFGTISKVDDTELQVEIAPEVKIRVAKDSIATVVTRSEPADSATSDKK
jgi:preprotein translocase subunit YajC